MKPLRWFIGVNIAALLVVSIWFRCRELGNLPGVNGDEAWYGVQAELVLHGEPISWRTPTGNALNPLFFGPQLLLHAFFQPSYALLRSTAVASGLLAIALNYLLCRKVFGRRTAIVSTVIIAVLPINIVYSRLAWDACQSLLVTLPAVYWSLRAITAPVWRTWFSAAAMIALAASIVIHPTNLFVGPVVGVCLLTAWRDELQFLRRRWKLLAAFAVLAFGLIAVFGSERGTAGLSRIASPNDYGAFAINLGRLFSGKTVIEYVAGATPRAATDQWRFDWFAYDVAAALVAGWLAIGLVHWLSIGKAAGDTPRGSNCGAVESNGNEADRRPARRLAAKSLLYGWGLSLAAFFAVAGPAAIAPHFERYGLCLIAPGVVLAALGVCGWLDCRSQVRDISALLIVLVGWLLLFTVRTELFDDIRSTGGNSHATFRTAAIEPKQQAFDDILRESGSQAEICTSEWWLYWPLRYLSLGHRSGGQVVVELTTSAATNSSAATAYAGHTWQVEFAGSRARESLRTLEQEGKAANEHEVYDYSGRPIISVFRIKGSAEATQ